MPSREDVFPENHGPHGLIIRLEQFLFVNLALDGTAGLDAGDVQQPGGVGDQVVGEVVHHGANLKLRISARGAHRGVSAVDDFGVRIDGKGHGHARQKFCKGQQRDTVRRHGTILTAERLGYQHYRDSLGDTLHENIDVLLERQCQG